MPPVAALRPMNIFPLTQGRREAPGGCQFGFPKPIKTTP